MNKPSQSRQQSATHKTSTSGTMNHAASSYWLLSRTLGMSVSFEYCVIPTQVVLWESQNPDSSRQHMKQVPSGTIHQAVQLLLAHFENPGNACVLLILCDSNTSSLVGVTKVKRKSIQSFNPEMKPEAFISSSSFQRKCLEVFTGRFLTVSRLRNGLSGALVQSHISLDSKDRRVFFIFCGSMEGQLVE
ncbi:hypothetical protein CDAR_623421 [Caerostris darwini]|uniref:Uncharacterized protein n=1 Tax=Caerostris darwini TaxID=1538125 RepID=A0AAV4STA3_9ARAC|nr:hypothetical protein CDAR_623421 [Caerostris darwini]